MPSVLKSPYPGSTVPTIDEVRSYYKWRGWYTDPNEFYKKMSESGWMINGSPIRNWIVEASKREHAFKEVEKIRLREEEDIFPSINTVEGRGEAVYIRRGENALGRKVMTKSEMFPGIGSGAYVLRVISCKFKQMFQGNSRITEFPPDNSREYVYLNAATLCQKYGYSDSMLESVFNAGISFGYTNLRDFVESGEFEECLIKESSKYVYILENESGEKTSSY